MLNRRENMLNRKSSSIVSGVAFSDVDLVQKSRQTPLTRGRRSDYAMNITGAKLKQFQDI